MAALVFRGALITKTNYPSFQEYNKIALSTVIRPKPMITTNDTLMLFSRPDNLGRNLLPERIHLLGYLAA